MHYHLQEKYGGSSNSTSRMRANLREKFIMGGTIREGTRTEATEEGIGLKISNVKMAIQNQSVIEFYTTSYSYNT